MLNLLLPLAAPPQYPADAEVEPGICDACDEPGLVRLTRRDGAICAGCYAESCDRAGLYVRACECCCARESVHEDDGQPWICPDCRAECHDWDDQGD